MLSLRVSRDKRGYDHIYLLLETRRKGRTVTRLLYGGRWPSPMRIGQQPLDDATRRALEQAYPEITFDWLALQKTLQQALSTPRAAPMGGPPGGDRRMRRGGGPPGAGAPGARPGQGGGVRGGPQGPLASRPPAAARPKPDAPAAYEPPEAALIADIPDAPGVIDIVELDDAGAADIGPDVELEVVEQTFVVSVSPTELVTGVPDQEPAAPDQQEQQSAAPRTAFRHEGDDAEDGESDDEDQGDDTPPPDAPGGAATAATAAGAPPPTNAARRRRRRRRRGRRPPQTAAEPFAAGGAEPTGPTEERARTESAPSTESDRAPDHPDDPPV